MPGVWQYVAHEALAMGIADSFEITFFGPMVRERRDIDAADGAASLTLRQNFFCDSIISPGITLHREASRCIHLFSSRMW